MIKILAKVCEKKKKRNQKGFTLVELIVVIVILAILAAILVPALLGYIDRAKDAKYVELGHTAEVAAKAAYVKGYAEGERLMMIKMNYTSNTQNGLSGSHYCILDNVYTYKNSNSLSNINQLGKSSVAYKCFNEFVNMFDSGDFRLSGTSWIFYDYNGNIVSNDNHKMAGQNAETQLLFLDKNKNKVVLLKYHDGEGWYVAQKY